MKKISPLLLIFISFCGFISALRCLQGQYKAAFKISGIPQECPKSDDVACAMIHNSNSDMAFFWCSNFSCTVSFCAIILFPNQN